MSIKYTSTSVNKWGLVSSSKSIEYETKPDRSGLVLVIGLILVAAIALFILTHI